MNRRDILKITALAAARNLPAAPSNAVPLFDGRTLNGWVDVENSWYSLQGASIADGVGFVNRLIGGADPFSSYLRTRLQDATKANLAGFASLDAKAQTAALSALGKEISAILTEPPLYEKARFSGVALRPETAAALKRPAGGADLAHLNKLLIEDAYPKEITRSPGPGWIAKDGVIASTGAGRGVLYTTGDYARFRFTFSIRHVSGNPDHQACVLIFCTRPKANEVPLDALAGIQFQPPNGGRWDYRPQMNNNGGGEFTLKSQTKFKPDQWNKVEILADASKGVARMSVNGTEMLTFRDAAAGKTGPIALQMHNAGLFDEYRDLMIEIDPDVDELDSVK